MTKRSQSLWNGRDEMMKAKTKLWRFIICETTILGLQVYSVCAISSSSLKRAVSGVINYMANEIITWHFLIKKITNCLVLIGS